MDITRFISKIMGTLVGILSVNGFTGQVFVHTWHGDLIEMIRE